MQSDAYLVVVSVSVLKFSKTVFGTKIYGNQIQMNKETKKLK